MMETDYVPRPEFDRYCKQQNGSLRRIEANIELISAKIDLLTAEDHKRVPLNVYNEDRGDLTKVLDKLRGKPSWAVAIIITFLSSACVALLIALLTRLI